MRLVPRLQEPFACSTSLRPRPGPGDTGPAVVGLERGVMPLSRGDIRGAGGNSHLEGFSRSRMDVGGSPTRCQRLS